MHILLPPSEGKTVPTTGLPLDLSTLTSPELTATRDTVLQSLIRLARGPADTARAVLGISARQVDELARDARLDSEPCAPARAVYSGVLYEALDLASLPTAARRRADRMLLIASGLFGMVSPADRIPAYRLSGDTDLPGVGPLASTWREPLSTALADTLRRGLIVDLRSSAYAALFIPETSMTERTVTMRVLQEKRVGGRTERVVVSHHNKATKGRLVRALLNDGTTPRSIPQLIVHCTNLGFTAELGATSRTGVQSVDIVVGHI